MQKKGASSSATGSKTSIKSAWKRLDLFGEAIQFTFKGESHYRTGIGATISLVCITLMIAFVSVRTKKLISRDDPLLTTTNNSHRDSLVRLGEQGFMFAIMDVDPRIGQIQAEWHQRRFEERSSTRELELADCREFLPGGRHEGKSNNQLFEIERITANSDVKFLCPVDIRWLSVTGIFGAKDFSYVKIKLKGC